MGSSSSLLGGCPAEPVIGRRSDRSGRIPLLKAALVTCAVAWAALASRADHWTYAAIIVSGSAAFALLWTPAAAVLSDAAAARQLDFVLAAAVMNLAWPPGQFFGAAVGALLAQVSSDAVAYAVACGLCLVALLVVHRSLRLSVS